MTDRELCESVPIGSWEICDEELLQARLNSPWRVIVASVLLQRTTRKQAEAALRRVLELWPTPKALGKALLVDVYATVRPCGFGQRRGMYLVKLSQKMARSEWDNLAELPGVGKYVQDAVRIVCFGSTECQSGDHALKEHLCKSRKSS